MAQLIEKPREVARGHFLLRIDIGTAASAPGQFANIRINGSLDPLLRRPFSIHDHNGTVIDVVVRVVGKGTAWLWDHAKPGEMDVLAPLGNGFTPIEKGTALLVGGGVGNAPLYYLARRLRERGTRVCYVYGARSEDCVFLRERYAGAADELHIVTDDGSCGEKGFSTDAAGRLAEETDFDAVYACGPAPMMAGTAAVFMKTKALLQVSMENYFGCGVGLCSGCTVETVSGNRRACIDGPVLDGRSIEWPSIYEDTDALSCGC
jgi:dihydroorotate dehydrogenase electron transfer subunit